MHAAPIVDVFPVRIPPGFQPSDVDGDGADRNASGKACPGYDPPAYRPRWGGGFDAPRGPKRLLHRAIDVMAAEGALVVSPGPAVVLRVELTPKGGNCLYLRDPNGFVWYFGHLRDRPLVEPGQHIESSTIVGLVGRTGNAVRTYVTAKGALRRGCPHLHASLTRPIGVVPSKLRGPDGLPVRYSGTKIDPVPWLRPLYNAGGWKR